MARTGVRTIQGNNLSSRGFILRPVYNAASLAQCLTYEDRHYDPATVTRTDNPRKIGRIEHTSLFSEAACHPLEIDLLIKAPQSDLYYIPEELEQFREFLERVIRTEHNRSPLAFVSGAYLQIRQGLESPAKEWHYDIGDPTRTYLCADNAPTIYAYDYPLIITPDITRAFARGNLSPTARYNLMAGSATDLSMIGKADIRSFKPYDIVTHNGLTLHKGPQTTGRTLVTLGYVDSNQIMPFGFSGYDNPMNADLAKRISAPVEEAGERFLHYYRQHHLERRGVSL